MLEDGQQVKKQKVILPGPTFIRCMKNRGSIESQSPLSDRVNNLLQKRRYAAISSKSGPRNEDETARLLLPVTLGISLAFVSLLCYSSVCFDCLLILSNSLHRRFHSAVSAAESRVYYGDDLMREEDDKRGMRKVHGRACFVNLLVLAVLSKCKKGIGKRLCELVLVAFVAFNAACYCAT